MRCMEMPACHPEYTHVEGAAEQAPEQIPPWIGHPFQPGLPLGGRGSVTTAG